MNEDDLWRVTHMLGAARDALLFVQGETRTTLEDDPRLAPALLMKIAIIGEAASRTGDDLRAAHPEVAWAKVVGMRNILVHAYFKIDMDAVWETVTRDLPQLIMQLEQIIQGQDS